MFDDLLDNSLEIGGAVIGGKIGSDLGSTIASAISDAMDYLPSWVESNFALRISDTGTDSVPSLPASVRVVPS